MINGTEPVGLASTHYRFSRCFSRRAAIRCSGKNNFKRNQSCQLNHKSNLVFAALL
jgi:hypothetical protein